MYDEQMRAAAQAAIATGESLNAISKRLGVSRSALREWRDNPEPRAFAGVVSRGWLPVGASAAGVRPANRVCRQREIVAEYPELFLRGLFNSDGCRAANWATRMALSLLDIPWRMPRPNALSVARKAAVARLDEFIGPKT